jgi:peptidoglycan/LPS O-acetylase OafA/YrhL
VERSETGPSRIRLQEIDALRGLAAVSVLLLHFTTDFHRDFKPSVLSDISWNYGAYGVHLFFMISGFVILMSAERFTRPRTFVLARASRLYPTYWAALALTSTLLLFADLPTAPAADQVVRRLLVNLTMVQSAVGVSSLDSVYWTLQVELSFYLVVIALIWRRAVDRALYVFVAFVALAVLEHVLVPRPLPTWWQHLRGLLIVEHVYLFTIGIVIYKARHGFRWSHAFVIGLCLLSPITADYFPNSPEMDTVVVACLAFVLYAATAGWLPGLRSRALLTLGALSYPLYASHHWVGFTVLHHGDRAGLAPNCALALAICTCLVVSWLIHRCIEMPAMSWVRARYGAPASVRGVRPASDAAPAPD